jgi:hypothetical protein
LYPNIQERIQKQKTLPHNHRGPCQEVHINVGGSSFALFQEKNQQERFRYYRTMTDQWFSKELVFTQNHGSPKTFKELVKKHQIFEGTHWFFENFQKPIPLTVILF